MAASSWEGGGQGATPAMSAPVASQGSTRLRVVTFNAGALDTRACLGPTKGRFREHLSKVVQRLVGLGAQLIGIQELNSEHGNWLREPG